MVGPASYSPRLAESHQDFNRALTTGNFHSPIAAKSEASFRISPAPNTYSINRIHTEKNRLITAQAAFNSKCVHHKL